MENKILKKLINLFFSLMIDEDKKNFLHFVQRTIYLKRENLYNTNNFYFLW